jgi:hypothetical protein
MQRISLAHQTLYAELQQQTLDAAFDGQFPENGSFVTKIRKGRKYWYYKVTRRRPGAPLRLANTRNTSVPRMTLTSPSGWKRSGAQRRVSGSAAHW